MRQSLEFEVIDDPNPSLSSIAISDSKTGASVLIGSLQEGRDLAEMIEREARRLWPEPPAVVRLRAGRRA